MEIRITDATNMEFIALTKQLDQKLSTFNGQQSQENRVAYDSFNQLNSIDQVFLAYEQEMAIGCAAYKKYDEKTLEVKRVFVNEQHRGQGVAKKLLRELEYQAKKAGFDILILETGRTNHTAIQAYKMLGYQKIKNYAPYIDMPDSICLKKII